MRSTEVYALGVVSGPPGQAIEAAVGTPHWSVFFAPLPDLGCGSSGWLVWNCRLYRL